MRPNQSATDASESFLKRSRTRPSGRVRSHRGVGRRARRRCIDDDHDRGPCLPGGRTGRRDLAGEPLPRQCARPALHPGLSQLRRRVNERRLGALEWTRTTTGREATDPSTSYTRATCIRRGSNRPICGVRGLVGRIWTSECRDAGATRWPVRRAPGHRGSARARSSAARAAGVRASFEDAPRAF
jgi:hypothetical protein